jgi:hypothetical protein
VLVTVYWRTTHHRASHSVDVTAVHDFIQTFNSLSTHLHICSVCLSVCPSLSLSLCLIRVCTLKTPPFHQYIYPFLTVCVNVRPNGRNHLQDLEVDGRIHNIKIDLKVYVVLGCRCRLNSAGLEYQELAILCVRGNEYSRSIISV